MDEAVQRVLDLVEESGFHLVATANAEMIMQAKHHRGLAQILHEADLVVPDGAGALWAAEQQGEAFPERVTGCDLAVQIFKKSATMGLPIYCLGAAPGVVEKAMAEMEGQFGSLRVVGYHSGFFDEEEEGRIIKDIEEKGAKVVLVAMGVPKQEEWLSTKLRHLDKVVGIGIGGTFDILAGHIDRAPKWMQKNRLEWLYRLMKQPSRAKRMLALPHFMWAVKRENRK